MKVSTKLAPDTVKLRKNHSAWSRKAGSEGIRIGARWLESTANVADWVRTTFAEAPTWNEAQDAIAEFYAQYPRSSEDRAVRKLNGRVRVAVHSVVEGVGHMATAGELGAKDLGERKGRSSRDLVTEKGHKKVAAVLASADTLNAFKTAHKPPAEPAKPAPRARKTTIGSGGSLPETVHEGLNVIRSILETMPGQTEDHVNAAMSRLVGSVTEWAERAAAAERKAAKTAERKAAKTATSKSGRKRSTKNGAQAARV